MNNVVTTPMPEVPDYNRARMEIINSMGLQGYLNSYKSFLKMQWLTRTEVQKEMNRVYWKAIHEMQSGYRYN